MNLEKLKQNKGWRMRLVPSATHFNRNGKALPETDEDWIVQNVTDQVVELTSVGGTQYQLLLGTDHIVSFFTDPPRDIDGLKHDGLHGRIPGGTIANAALIVSG